MNAWVSWQKLFFLRLVVQVVQTLGGEFQSVLDALEGLMESNPDLSMTLLPPIEYMGGDAPPFYQDLENLDVSIVILFEEYCMF